MFQLDFVASKVLFKYAITFFNFIAHVYLIQESASKSRKYKLIIYNFNIFFFILFYFKLIYLKL